MGLVPFEKLSEMRREMISLCPVKTQLTPLEAGSRLSPEPDPASTLISDFRLQNQEKEIFVV